MTGFKCGGEMARIRHLGIHLKLHNGKHLEKILSQIRYLTQRREGLLVIECGGNSITTIETLDRLLVRQPSRLDPILCWEQGDLIVEGEAVLSLSDDLLFSENALQEMKAHLNNLQFDKIEARRLFCWGAEDHHNTIFPKTYSTILMTEIKRRHRHTRMRYPLLDMSFMTTEDRLLHPGVDTKLSRILATPEKVARVPHGN